MGGRNFPESQDSLVSSFPVLERTKLVGLLCSDYLYSAVEDTQHLLLLKLSDFNNWNFYLLCITQINEKYFLFYSQQVRRKTNEGLGDVHPTLHQVSLRQSTTKVIIYILLSYSY
jgi:hypothetical protein